MFRDSPSRSQEPGRGAQGQDRCSRVKPPAPKPFLGQFPSCVPWAGLLTSLNIPFICRTDVSYSRVSMEKSGNSSCSWGDLGPLQDSSAF